MKQTKSFKPASIMLNWPMRRFSSTSFPLIKQWKGSSILSVSQFNRSHVESVLDLAKSLKLTQSSNALAGNVLANVFYEASTRTTSSFQAAMYKSGGQVVTMSDVANSSVSKGETLSDTVRTLQSYADVIVLRHPIVGSAAEAASYLEIPLINAGDGAGEHPTQAMLDTFTIQQELGTLDNINITLLGDLKHGRTVHSLARLLKHFKVSFNYVSPDFLQMPDDVQNELKAAGIQQESFSTLDKCLPNTDILYVTRVQKERFSDIKLYEKAQSNYVINAKSIEKAKKSMRIMHPLPRVGELAPELDNDPRAAYFRQMRNGLFTRMALLQLVVNGDVKR